MRKHTLTTQRMSGGGGLHCNAGTMGVRMDFLGAGSTEVREGHLSTWLGTLLEGLCSSGAF